MEYQGGGREEGEYNAQPGAWALKLQTQGMERKNKSKLDILSNKAYREQGGRKGMEMEGGHAEAMNFEKTYKKE